MSDDTQDLLDLFREKDLLDGADTAFARMLARVTGYNDPVAMLGAALAFRAPRAGHTCLDVTLAQETLGTIESVSLPWPPSEVWLEALRKAPYVRTGGNDDTPLVLDGPRLYLERYYFEECCLAREVLHRVGEPRGPDAPDGVAQAASLATRSRLVLLTGGPGTGKTSAAAEILVSIARAGRDPGHIALLAPTGKAASRLAEAVRESLGRLEIPEDLRSRFPASGMTLHRALGLNPEQPFALPKPRDFEAVVVDEASMMDLLTAVRLFQAVPKCASLILVGDAHQLASVEAGSVFSDLCEAPALAGVQVRLRHRRRYEGAIGALADAVVTGDEARALEVLRSGDPQVEHVGQGSGRLWHQRLRERTVEGLAPYVAAVQSGDKAAALRAARRFRILCAMRRGPFGCETLNEDAIRWLWGTATDETFFPGRIVLVTANDPDTGLFNGDMGVVVARGDGLVVCFEGSEPGALREFSPSRLPPHEDAFAITIHKSQGSEFDEVAVVLPPFHSPLLTRELLYTGLTRATRRVTLIARPDTVVQAIRTRTVRASGLRERLRTAASSSWS